MKNNIFKKCVAIILATIVFLGNLELPQVYAYDQGQTFTEEEKSEQEEIQEELLLNYVAIQNAEVEVPGTQKIAVSLGNETNGVQSAQ